MYGESKDLREQLLHKRITEWTKEKLVLEDGTVVTLEESESDCCASAYGQFSNVELDAVITEIEIGAPVSIPDNDTIVNEVRVILFHNQNPIAQADMTADAGNGGFYYSIGSLVVKGVHYQIVDA